MSDDLKLTLPERKVKISWVRSPLFFLLIAALALGAANIVLALALRGGAAAALPAGKQQALALQLEGQGLHAPAVEAWKAYLSTPYLGAKEKAAVWYRIGRIQQEASAPEEALASYYRSEAVFRDASTQKELDRRVQECLESLGKYAALRQELARRVGVKDDTASTEVLAEVAGEKITQAALDKKIADAIRMQLSPYASSLATEELFRRYSTREARQQFLNQYLVEQMLYLKALDDKLPEDPDVKNLLRDADRQVLARSALTRAMADGIRITATDVSAYYEANKGRYKDGEKQRPFEEVKDQAASDLQNAKAKDLQDSLIEELKKKYDVVFNAGSVNAEQSK